MMEIAEHFIEDENYKKYNINLDILKNKCYTNNENEELVNILKLFTVESVEELEALRGVDYMDEAIDEIKRLCQDENIIGLYDAEAVARKEMNSRLEYAMQQGVEHEKLETAKRMLEKEISIETITEITNLTKEQIEKLKFVDPL